MFFLESKVKREKQGEFLMRKWLAAGVSTLLMTSGLFVAASMPAQASDDTADSDYRITPFQLIGLAHQGTLSKQGIPGYAGLRSKYRQEEIQAKDLVEAAIESGRLPDSAMDDEDYLDSVETQLNALDKPSNN